MYYRQKFLLALLEQLPGRCSHTDFQTLLFLACSRQEQSLYDFVPYHYGCFSFEANADLHSLQNKEIITSDDDWIRKKGKSEFYDTLKETDREILDNILKEFSAYRGNKLLKYLYLNFPYYAGRSEHLDEVLTSAERKKIPKTRKPRSKTVFTIGYEGRSIDSYLNLLIKNNIPLVCDVRGNPLSRKTAFSRKQLQETLNKMGIEYLHFPELGIPTTKRKNVKSFEDYQKLFRKYERTTLKKEVAALDTLIDLSLKRKRIALTCFEADPACCHRGSIARALENHRRWDSTLCHL